MANSFFTSFFSFSNMSHLSFIDTVVKNDGICIDYGSKGTVVKDKSGYHQRLFAPHANDDLVTEELKSFYTDVNDYFDKLSKAEDRLPEQFGITIHLKVEDVWNFLDDSALIAFLSALSENRFVNLILHFQEPPASWKANLKKFVSNLSKRLQSGLLRLTLSGTFVKSSVEELEFLIDRHINLQHVGRNLNEVSIDQSTIFHFADFGFRIPIIWYVDTNNINLINKDVIGDCMACNYNSGFGLPSIQLSPFFKLKSADNLPLYTDYVSLLSDVYKNLSHYDDVLQPLNLIADTCTKNGYSRFNDCTRNISLLIDADRELSFFGHSPFLSVTWLNWDGLRDIPTDGIFSHLVENFSSLQKRCQADRCKTCKWKHVCGGEFTEDKFSLDNHTDYCRLLDFFFRVFIWQSVQVVGTFDESKKMAKSSDTFDG